jgi:DNA gyrase/topoisomerase IV subunit B
MVLFGREKCQAPVGRAGIAKLDDANDAGTKNSHDCTLILTEGDSAKTMAVSGLSVVGRDRYGVFPLRSSNIPPHHESPTLS